MKNKKGFTLVELIIVIAILAIIMLIGTAAYSSIQERMKVRADKATAGQIGKAIKIRETDVGEENGIGLYPSVIEYDSIDGIENYIAKEIKPQSMEDGNFVATAFQTQTGKKIVVGIGKKVGEEGSEKYSIGDKVYNGKDEAGWAWSEDIAVDEFLKDESVSDSIVVGDIPEVYSRINVGDTFDFYYVADNQTTTIDGVNYKIKGVRLWKVNSNSKGQLGLLPLTNEEWWYKFDLTNVKSLSELDDDTVSQLNAWYQQSIFETENSKYVDKAIIYGFKEEGGYICLYSSILLKQNIDIDTTWNSHSSSMGVFTTYWCVKGMEGEGFIPDMSDWY